MTRMRFERVAALAMVALCMGVINASAQITTGTVAGTVKDAQGGVVPGATVVLISQARGTRTAPAVTNAQGDYVIANVTADTYTVEVTMEGFKTIKRSDIAVSGGDRVAVPALTLEVGGAAETVNVSAEAPLVQSQSGERSFAVTTEQIENLPIARGNFTNLIALTPGVMSGGASGDGARLGGTGVGASQNNIMMDGISAMDTGNNGQMLNMNIESIGEVKILTQGYQAEYGRSSGLQITAVTKSGTNQFHGSGYGVFTNSDWNKNYVGPAEERRREAELRAARPRLHHRRPGRQARCGATSCSSSTRTSTSRRRTRSTAATPSGTASRRRSSAPATSPRAATTTAHRSRRLTTIRTGGPFPGNQIPANRLYAPGVAVLNRYPLPNLDASRRARTTTTRCRPRRSTDLSAASRQNRLPAVGEAALLGQVLGAAAAPLVTPGLIPGFNECLHAASLHHQLCGHG